MTRPSRMVCEGMPHHVTQRGNYRQRVFETPKDFQAYSFKAADCAQKYGVEIVAYCFMPNHVHFIVIPEKKDSLAQFFRDLQVYYSKLKHEESACVGHLWQGRFYSSVLDEEHLLHAVRYVEQNPVRAQLVHHPSQYIWSSARFHLGMESHPIISTTGREQIGRLLEGKPWVDYISQEDKTISDFIRLQTKNGYAIATKENISLIEQKFGIILQAKKMGRPKKSLKSDTQITFLKSSA